MLVLSLIYNLPLRLSDKSGWSPRQHRAPIEIKARRGTDLRLGKPHQTRNAIKTQRKQFGYRARGELRSPNSCAACMQCTPVQRAIRNSRFSDLGCTCSPSQPDPSTVNLQAHTTDGTWHKTHNNQQATTKLAKVEPTKPEVVNPTRRAVQFVAEANQIKPAQTPVAPEAK